MLSADELAGQAGVTAAQWMRAAVDSIDATFGEGYAKKHPELVAGFMQLCRLRRLIRRVCIFVNWQRGN